MHDGDEVGRYRIDGRIGEGGMGVVHAATDRVLGRRVALKVLSDRFADDPQVRARFEREATALARLDSPWVITIYDHGMVGESPYLVMQYISGGDLGALLATRGPLPPALAADVVAQVADALASAHRVGIVHRDVKPSNVLVDDPDARPLRVYLCDFGIAHTAEPGVRTAGVLPGTWDYLAPELGEGAPPGPASDVYAAGCLLHECLTGRPPYVGSQLHVAAAHRSAPVPRLAGGDPVTRRLNGVLGRALAKHPRDRYHSAAALRDDLRRAALRDDLRRAATPAPVPQKSRRPRTRGLVAAGAALAVGAAGLWVASDRGNHTDRAAGSSSTAPSAETSAGASGAALPSRHGATGDLDGDGRGDLRVTMSTGRRQLTWSYDGSSLGRPRVAAVPRRAGRLVTGDIDGDGVEDSVRFLAASVGRASVTLTGGGSSYTVVAVPADDLVPATGDFDGDGDDDLAVSGRAADGTLRVWVLSSAGGRLGRPAPWLRRGPAVPHRFRLLPGDFDGDGTADLALDVPRGPDQSAGHDMSLLRSSGRGFAATGRTRRVPAELEGSMQVVAGDPDGDGAAELVRYAVPSLTDGAHVDVLDAGRAGFGPPRRWLRFDGGIVSPLGDRPWDVRIAMVDLDADGRDDIARVSGPDGQHRWLVDALLSTGRALRPPGVSSTYDCGVSCALARTTLWAPA